ncbi:uncharacterized protein LOC116304200 [Actinia tenebrosa]|uniref:Uncharacterized protein LOC116304200 n=1 Tax=Actinia tenebrosa TaxID=6105 RepID=A0A6P8IU87_ACTTE|nr:uncharacterized protein LOC116304200 [Actinia tenebrosa]
MKDYHVDDRDNELFTTSPEWYYSNTINKTRIAADAKTYVSGRFEWRWYLAPSCPARLRHRLGKESVATLVISNVTTRDNGKYSCSLVLRGGKKPIKSATQLVVTVSISSPGPLTREVGQDVVFMINATNIVGVNWGIRDGNTNKLQQGLINYNKADGIQLDKKINSTSW